MMNGSPAIMVAGDNARPTAAASLFAGFSPALATPAMAPRTRRLAAVACRICAVARNRQVASAREANRNTRTALNAL